MEDMLSEYETVCLVANELLVPLQQDGSYATGQSVMEWVKNVGRRSLDVVLLARAKNHGLRVCGRLQGAASKGVAGQPITMRLTPQLPAVGLAKMLHIATDHI